MDIESSYGGSFSAPLDPWPESAVREVETLQEVIASLSSDRGELRELATEALRALRQALTCLGGCDEAPECVHVLDIVPVVELLKKTLEK